MSTYSDFHTMIYGEDGEKPLRPTIERCMEQAREDNERLRVEVRTKPLGTTTSRQEHVFSVDAEENYIDTVMSAVYDRLTSSPGEGFEGEIRINFYQAGNTACKYGSFTRKIRSSDSLSSEGNSFMQGMNPMMAGMNPMGGSMNNPMGGLEGSDDFSGLEGDGFDENAFNEPQGSGGLGGMNQQSNGMEMNQMMQMMQMMQQNQQVDPKNIVDQKMAMDWLNHTMSFLFRSLSQQMAMFERSTKMIEIYSMRFGLPQPLERPSPERIIREVPMDYPQAASHPTAPQPPEPSGLGILPTLLTAAAQLAGSPGAANMLKTAGALAGGLTGNKPAAPPPQQPPQIQNPQRRKPRTRVEKAGPPVRHKKPSPPKPAKPVVDTDEFGWETESPPMRMDNSARMGGGSGSEEFNFGLDGTSTVPINPFGRETPPNNPFGGSETDFGDMNFNDMDFGDVDLGGIDPNEEIQLPPDFPDLNGMSADEMKKTVIDWIQADPDNRKTQIMEMLPELSALIM
jgi:hypothetical protein